jgi:hypothetical protein
LAGVLHAAQMGWSVFWSLAILNQINACATDCANDHAQNEGGDGLPKPNQENADAKNQDKGQRNK